MKCRTLISDQDINGRTDLPSKLEKNKTCKIILRKNQSSFTHQFIKVPMSKNDF